MSFQVGGSVSAEQSVYIERQADTDLYHALNNGELCYVFNSRQMGKSSLLLNVKSRLTEEGKHCCFVDISRIGSVNITSDQWYAGIISELWRGFGLPTGKALMSWWSSLSELSAPHKLSVFLEQVLPKHHSTQDCIIFFDEVDSVLSLPFSADDFFSVMRACYNRKAENADIGRVKFALFGVAIPSDLIHEPTRSPFNVGRAIRLEGFKYQEALPFAEKLQVEGYSKLRVLSRILYWSNGQPFLTQKLCHIVNKYSAEMSETNEEMLVDNLVDQYVLDNWESHDNPEHIRTIRDRILLDERISTQILSNYLTILDSPNHSIESSNIVDLNRLYLTGLVAVNGNVVTPRTLVYQTIFTKSWVVKALNQQRPYDKKMSLWQQSNTKDNQWLLQENELKSAQQWAANKNLPDADHRFLNASQKMVNEQVKAWNKKLENEIEQRKQAELKLKTMIEAFKKAKSEAEQANNAKTSFLTRVSHEVRTHMNSVMGLSYIATQNAYDDESRNSLMKINRAAKYMLGVVNDIVDINKVERGEFVLRSETFFLDDVLDHVIDTVGFSLHEKGLTFYLDMPKTPLTALIGDPNRLEQLLTNLMTNAIKYTDKGSVSLSVRVEKFNVQEPERFKLYFMIKDTGGGISTQPLKFAVSDQKNNDIQIGIGLNLCSELANMMGGKLQLKSEPNQGTIFDFDANFVVAKGRWQSNANQLPLYIDSSIHFPKFIEQCRQLGYDIHDVTIDEHLSLDIETPSVLIADEHQLKNQSVILDALERNPLLFLLPILNLNEPSPHWLSALGVNHRIEYPCSLHRLDETIQHCITITKKPPLQINLFRNDNVRILVAEDDEINQEIVKELLTKINVKCDVVSNGEEAYFQATQRQYDVVLMDIEMPVLDGISSMKKIRARANDAEYKYLKQLPIIAMTAHALLDERKRFINAGMNDHVSKPIEPLDLYRVINQWLPKVKLNYPEYAMEDPEAYGVSIDGVDFQAGLARCGNNYELYIKVLKQFAHKYSDGLLFEHESVVVITRICHAIKGSTANLGIKSVSKLAAEIEQIGLQDKQPSTMMLSNLSSLLKDVSVKILEAIPKYQEQKSEVTTDIIATQLTTFLAVIDEDHGQANDAMSALMHSTDDKIISICDAMSVFDIDLAKTIAQQWLSNHAT